MKKLLSVLLAALMLFGSLGMSASALSLGGSGVDYIPPSQAEIAEKIQGNDFVMYFSNSEGFTLWPGTELYVSGKGFQTVKDSYNGSFYMLPRNSGQYYFGCTVTLPELVDTEAFDFKGWWCKSDKNASDPFFAGRDVVITQDMADANDSIVKFSPYYGQNGPAEDTMGMVIDILCKIFGAIFGLLFCNGDTALGILKVQEILGGIMG